MKISSNDGILSGVGTDYGTVCRNHFVGMLARRGLNRNEVIIIWVTPHRAKISTQNIIFDLSLLK